MGTEYPRGVFMGVVGETGVQEQVGVSSGLERWTQRPDKGLGVETLHGSQPSEGGYQRKAEDK